MAPKGLRYQGSTLVRFDQETLPFTRLRRKPRLSSRGERRSGCPPKPWRRRAASVGSAEALIGATAVKPWGSTFSCTRDAGSSMRKLPLHSLSPTNSEDKKNIPLLRIRGAFPSYEVTPEALVQKIVPPVRTHGGTFEWGQANMSKGHRRPSII